jgi:hypothetical protein
MDAARKERLDSQKAKLGFTMKTREVRFKPTLGNPLQAPGQHSPIYNTDSTKPRSHNYTFGLNKSDRFKMSPEIKMKKDWPGPMTKYNLDKAYARTTLGARRGYK